MSEPKNKIEKTYPTEALLNSKALAGYQQDFARVLLTKSAYIQNAASAIDLLLGTNLSSAVSGFRQGVRGFVQDVFGENEVQIRRMEMTEYKDAWNNGSEKGRAAGSFLDNFNPEDFLSKAGEGFAPNYGTAPIGAKVTVATPETVEINVSAALVVGPGYTAAQLAQPVRQAVEDYLLAIRQEWDQPEESGMTHYASWVYAARVTAAMLSVQGVVNVTGLTINGAAADLQLTEDGLLQQVPVLGEVTVSA